MIGIKSKRIISDTAIYIILTVMVLVWLFPILWMILRSFDTENLTLTAPYVFPDFDKLGPNAYKALFFGGDPNDHAGFYADYNTFPYIDWMINTAIIAVGSCIISTLMVLMVSYALSRLRFKARKKLMNIALILGLFPGFLSMIILYYFFKNIGLAGQAGRDGRVANIIGLILAYSLASGAGYYIVKGFFDTVPMAIDEAARIDGATKNRIFWQMIIPLSKPIIIYTVLTTFIGPWCDFMMAKVFTQQSANSYTIAVGLQSMLKGKDVDPNYFTRFCAGGLLISVPIVALYLIMQKFYVAGITGGAAKG